MGSLVATLVESIMPSLSSLISDPHASPPVRLLLLVLSPNRELPSLEGGDDRIRSKKSDKFRKKQEVKGKSIFGEDEAKSKGKSAARRLPADVRGLRRKIREALMRALGGGEWKIVGGHQVGSIVVQVGASWGRERRRLMADDAGFRGRGRRSRKGGIAV